MLLVSVPNQATVWVFETGLRESVRCLNTHRIRTDRFVTLLAHSIVVGHFVPFVPVLVVLAVTNLDVWVVRVVAHFALNNRRNIPHFVPIHRVNYITSPQIFAPLIRSALRLWWCNFIGVKGHLNLLYGDVLVVLNRDSDDSCLVVVYYGGDAPPTPHVYLPLHVTLVCVNLVVRFQIIAPLALLR